MHKGAVELHQEHARLAPVFVPAGSMLADVADHLLESVQIASLCVKEGNMLTVVEGRPLANAQIVFQFAN